MSFIGQAEVTIDKKSRLAVPAKFRAALEVGKLGPAWVSMPRGPGVLWMIPEVSFDDLSDQWGDTLIPDADTEAIELLLFSLSEKIEMDATGRVTVPRKHLELTGLDGEVVVIGVKSRLEIHDRAVWLEREKERLARLPELIAKMAARKRQD